MNGTIVCSVQTVGGSCNLLATKASTFLGQRHGDAFHLLHGPEVPLCVNQEDVKHWSLRLMDLCYCLALGNMERHVLSSADSVTILVDRLLIGNSASLRTVS